MDRGEAVGDVARRVADLLRAPGLIVCTDAPVFDAVWLRRLLEAGCFDVPVRLTDVHEVYGQVCRPLLAGATARTGTLDDDVRGRLVRRCAEIVSAAEEAETERDRPRHRAHRDAEGLRWTWQAIADEVVRRIASST